MKKIFTVLVLGVALMLPLSASAMSQLTDSDLSDVTGQSGVSIIMDITMDIHFDVLAWGDADGIGTVAGTTGGWVGLSNLNINGLRIRYIPEKFNSVGFSYNCWN
jgi:hypothetical protein